MTSQLVMYHLYGMVHKTHGDIKRVAMGFLFGLMAG